MNTANYSQPNKIFYFSGGLAELVDAYALGAYDFGHESSSLLSPTSKTSKSNEYWKNFCCTSCCIEEDLLHNGVGELLGQVGSETLVSLRIYTPIIITFISAYSSSIATAFFKYNIICTSE